MNFGLIGFRFLTSPWGRYIVLALGLLVALTTWGRSKRKQGQKEAVDAIKSDVRERTERGTDAFHDSRREATGSDVDALVDSMRGNDRHWGRLPNIR